MATIPKSYTSEVGSAVNLGPSGNLMSYEDNPDLVWPYSMRVFDQMRRTDGQIASVLRAMSLLILGTEWSLKGADVNPKVMDFVESQLGLQLNQDGFHRADQSNIDFYQFIRQALTYGPFGHSIFESIYEAGDRGKQITGLPVTAHLSRLSFRPQRTIAEFLVNDDGSLQAIKQYVQNRDNVFTRLDVVDIPADQLVVFVSDREGGDWIGQSWLRPCWFNWSTKVKLTILDAIGIERNSVGIPKVTYLTGESEAKALRLGQEIRGGERNAVAVPEGANVELMGVNGSTRDPLPSIKYHDEVIGRSLLAMVLNLGHDRGAKSLGETMYDMFCASLNSITTYMSSVVTESVIRSLVALNFGSDEPYPILGADQIQADSALVPDQLKALTDAGILIPDPILEEDIRRRYDLPAPDPSFVPPAPPVATAPIIPMNPSDVPGMTLAASKASSPLEDLESRVESLKRQIHDRKKAESR